MDLSSKFWSPLIWLLEKLNRDPYENMNPKDYRLLGSHDQLLRIPRNKLTYYYLLIGQETMSLLTEVYYVERYIKPSDELNRKYLILIELLDNLGKLKHDPNNKFNFKKYPDLFQSNTTEKDFWKVEGEYHDPRFGTEMQVDRYGGVTVLPDDLDNLLMEIHELVTDFKYQKNIKTKHKNSISSSKLPDTFYWDKTGKEYVLDDSHKIVFTAKISKKIKLFKMLTDENGGWVSKKDIAKKLKIKDEDIRSMISQLKKDIKKYKSDEIITIDTNNSGSIKLTSNR
jgi:hypothetical protein